jgi:hypothetical protein
MTTETKMGATEALAVLDAALRHSASMKPEVLHEARDAFAALVVHTDALETTAARWRDLAGRFDDAKNVRGDIVLQGLGYPDDKPWLPLAEIVDAARAEAGDA